RDRRRLSRMAELSGSADVLLRPSISCYFSSDIRREHAASPNSLWIVFERGPSNNHFSLVQIFVLGVSRRLLQDAFIICSLRHYHTWDDCVFPLYRNGLSQSMGPWRYNDLVDGNSLLPASGNPIVDKSFPEARSHDFSLRLCNPL